MEQNKQYSEMMNKYWETKRQYPDCIIFYRLGDFYEMFFDDALKASEILNITLTKRDCGFGKKAPMCGIPFHAASTYLTKLTEAGLKVAICEQLTEAKPGKMVERGVVRVVTPGTIMEENQLNENQNNYIAAVSCERTSLVGLAWIDLSTGEFCVQQFVGENAFLRMGDVLVSIMPKEIIADSFSFAESVKLPCEKMAIIPEFSEYPNEKFNFEKSIKVLLKQINVDNLSKIGCTNKSQAVCAAGALIQYLNETQMRDLSHINRVKIINDGNYMHLDVNTRLNLEICENMFDRKKRGSLLWALDKTYTSMGARLLRNWLEHPLQSAEEINLRLESVEELTQNVFARTEISELLKNLNDIERLCGRASYGNLNPRNCVALGEALKRLPNIKKNLNTFNSKLLLQCAKNISPLKDLADELEKAFVTDAPLTIKDGGFIKEGFDDELDKCFTAKREGQNWIIELEAKERELTGEKKLKISYNRVSGYYFEVPKSSAENLPFRFQRIQTRTTNDRFSTTDLKKLEETILTASEQTLSIELKIFDKIRNDILIKMVEIQRSARQIAILDCLLSLAQVAVENDYSKPVINDEVRNFEIIESRHPVVERLMQGERFVPNDVLFNDDQRTIIITGPNMAGKSTYMRQVALITLMAHVGSFVPAKSANIALTDRIFTRIGASDNLGMGQSTFMVEMVEVANIIKNATADSLLILDEIGRGTSSQDGFSIAWSVLEYIATNIKSRTLFATHYHKLTDLQGKIPGVINMRVTVSEFDNQMSFLRKVEYGSTNKSFGIEVAKLAGLPTTIISRAKEVMQDQQLEQDKAFDTAMEQYNSDELQLKAKYEVLAEIIKHINVNNLTPLEALSKIAELKSKVE